VKRAKDPDLENRFRQEIADARSGVRPYVTRKAAAWYLGMHWTSLTKLQKEGLGPPSIVHDRSKQTNAHQFYELSDLDAWMSSRKVRFYGDKADISTLDLLKRREQAMKLQAEISRMKERLGRLQRRLAKDGPGSPKP
jgi:hypothetical protein